MYTRNYKMHTCAYTWCDIRKPMFLSERHVSIRIQAQSEHLSEHPIASVTWQSTKITVGKDLTHELAKHIQINKLIKKDPQAIGAYYISAVAIVAILHKSIKRDLHNYCDR